MFTRLLAAFGLLTLLTSPAAAEDPEKIRVLIIDGQNNHGVWPKSTIMMQAYLEETGLFAVDIQRAHYLWRSEPQQAWLPLANTGPAESREEPVTDPGFAPEFSNYDVVVSNFGWRAADWPLATRLAFESFVEGGGGFVAVHAADNSFPDWQAYNLMIGLGGWGDRDENDGPYVYYTNEGELVRDDTPGPAGAHGPRHAFPITVRAPEHPIMRGMPPVWMASEDECYAKLRGPAVNMTVLATCKDMSEAPPTDRHEPAMMVLTYGEGRIFHLTLGHDTAAFEGVGLITALLRGTEWAATGNVTQPVPDDFPTADAESRRTFANPQWTSLLDEELSAWEVWTGVIPDQPDGDNQALFTQGTPYGPGDPHNLFRYGETEDGAPYLYISGEYYAGLTSLKTYANYHFTADFRWGEAKYFPRKNRKRDNGILYHCYGEHGAFWNVWKSCPEMQVQEGDMGDLFLLAGPRAKVRYDETGHWDPTAEPAAPNGRMIRRFNNESPHGQWNRLDVYVLGNTAIHMVNGAVVMVAEDIVRDDGTPLSEGHIQIQSEGAEAWYRDMRIRPIDAFPAAVRDEAGLAE